MDHVTFVVTGAAELARELGRLGEDLEAPSLMRPIAEDAARALAAASPRKSGALAASWRPIVSPGRAAAESALPYAGVIDRGWPARGIAPARIRERADQTTTTRAVEQLEDGINQKIRARGLHR